MTINTQGPSAKQLFTMVWVFTAFVASMAAVYTIQSVTEDEPFTPLHSYNIQTVDSVSDTTVTITGTKCHNFDGPLDVVGEFNWFRVVPPGFGTVPVQGFRSQVLPGCNTETFINTIPSAVLAANDSGDVWFLTGTEWPIDPDTGDLGVPITWVTENFSLNS